MKINIFVLNTFKNDSRVLKIFEHFSANPQNQVDLVAIWASNLNLPVFLKSENQSTRRIKLKVNFLNGILLFKLLRYFEFIYKAIKLPGKYDICYCNDLNTLPIGVAKKFLGKCEYVIYDSHEYQRETAGSKGIRRFLIATLEKLLIKYADSTFTVSDSIAHEYEKIYNIKKPTVVLNSLPNTPPPKSDKLREEFGIEENEKIFLFQGGFTQGRGLETILHSFLHLGEPNHLILMGFGPMLDRVTEYVNSAPNIHFLAAVSPKDVISYTASADAGILFYENTCLNHYYCMPNKLFEYMAAGIPVIASPLFDLQKIVNKYSLGIVANDFSSAAFTAAVKNMAAKEHYQENLRKARQDFNWHAQLEKIDSQITLLAQSKTIEHKNHAKTI